MTPHEKAVNAINTRLERLQANLREAKGESAQRFLFQSIVVTVGAAEALNDYIKAVGEYAQRRHAEVKQINETLSVQHNDLLKSGQALLEQLKANPNERAFLKEIEVTQQKMEAVQKALRREANALQRELAPSLAMIDELAGSVRRFAEADQADALKRLVKIMVGHVRELYSAQLGPVAKNVIDAETWEKSIMSEIDGVTDFYDAYARAGYQVTLALQLMTVVLASNPPQTAEEATGQANEALTARLKEITARITAA